MTGERFRVLAASCAVAFGLSACGGGGHGSSSPAPAVSPSPSPSPGSSSSPDLAAYVCPTSDGSSTAPIETGAQPYDSSRRIAASRRSVASVAAPQTSGTQLIAVNYGASAASTEKTVLAARESTLGGSLVNTLTFPTTGVVTHVVAVPAAQVTAFENAIKSTAGVKSVGLTGQRRYTMSVNAPYYPTDPYFTGFATTEDQQATTYETVGGTVPLIESSTVPGQWDMHTPRFEYAFGYSQSGNARVTNANALGSSNIKIAIIDTGEDSLHPELKSKITYQKCYVTNPNNVQSSSSFSPDPQGHGTNVTGIAAADLGNGLGFAGAGGNSVIYAYRVFPEPDDNCTNENTTDNQCSTNTSDIASAILDAISKKVNVISLSLGGGSCASPGVDPDSTEGNAVAEAIANNIVVVAATGNSAPMTTAVSAPACDDGVIAVGATSIADGSANGSGVSSGSPGSPVEYVASYSQYGSPASAVDSSSSWGIVAPGGDPISATDADDLHWVENTWTTTPYQSSSSDIDFLGECGPDYPNASGTTDCRELIAGTSMATPHVAGAAALIIAANSSYQSPSKMKQLLCQYADDISDPHEGCGRLDVYRAMAIALGDTDPGPQTQF